MLTSRKSGFISVPHSTKWTARISPANDEKVVSRDMSFFSLFALGMAKKQVFGLFECKWVKNRRSSIR